MKRNWILLTVLLTALSAFPSTYYVDASRPDDSGSATSWATAKKTIQAAVDLAKNGDTVWVTNGVYTRTVVTSDILIRSVNGPNATIIDANSIENGLDYIGLNLGNSKCVISGFTITRGLISSRSSAGGAGVQCADSNPIITNCVIRGNISWSGGGGVYKGRVYSSTIADNRAPRNSGGGLRGSYAYGCVISNNGAVFGGGLSGGSAYNCVISGNWAARYSIIIPSAGGGAEGAAIYNSLITRNNSYDSAGGVSGGSVYNCTIIRNTAKSGGGMSGGNAFNSILYYNTDYAASSAGYQYCCAENASSGSGGNITNAPQLLTTYGIAETSPCRGSGSAAYASGLDLDGDAWETTPSMGCKEFISPLTGILSLELSGPTNLIIELYADYVLTVTGDATRTELDTGDGTTYTNLTDVSHSWKTPGNYEVVASVYNDEFPAGLFVTQLVHAVSLEEGAVYVSLTGNDQNDGLSWETAKATIPGGLNAATDYGAVLVGAGFYSLSNTICLTNTVLLKGVAGSENTILDAGGKRQCVSIATEHSVLDGFTVAHGSAGSGGGIYCPSLAPVIRNCIIENCTAEDAGGGVYGGTVRDSIIRNNLVGDAATDGLGGGLYNSTIYNCIITGNSAVGGGGIAGSIAYNSLIEGNSARDRDVVGGIGGGAYASKLYNCNVVDNKAQYVGGGIGAGSIAYNSIVWFNTADQAGLFDLLTGISGNDVDSRPASITAPCTLYNCCSMDVSHGVGGNITNYPALVSSTRISINSPCLGAGNSKWATGTDLDGDVWRAPPSIGCDEVVRPLKGEIKISLDGPSTVVEGEVSAYVITLEGNIARSRIDAGDGSWAENLVYAWYAWDQPGLYDLTITAWNDDYPSGTSITQRVRVVASNAVMHVSKDGDDSAEGWSWETAKATIQAGVNAQVVTGGKVVVADGTYNLAASINIPAGKNVALQGVSGPENTILDAGGNGRCITIDNPDGLISGFTITGGYVSGGGYGGGINSTYSSVIISNCVITGNYASGNGGGVRGGTSVNCIIEGNQAGSQGGGIDWGYARNCLISGNSASRAGGINAINVQNCTVVYNSGGGLISSGPVDNSIVYYNDSQEFFNGRNSCSLGLGHGVNGNITNEPLLIAAAHIASNSPCIGAGTAAYASGVDIDGEAWANPPSMGCDENPASGSCMGDIFLQIRGPQRTIVDAEENYYLDIRGRLTRSVIDFGNGHIVTNGIYLNNAWVSVGTYDVVLTAFNETYPAGTSVTQRVEVLELPDAGIYVSQFAGSDSNTGYSWNAAKKTIQAGIDAQRFDHGTVWVSNGVYTLDSEILIERDINLIGVNGPSVTVVDGAGSNRCFNLSGSSCLVSGFTITNGAGGVYCSDNSPVVSNCVIVGNISTGNGGGIYGGTVRNCTIAGNVGAQGGGGCSSVIHNSAIYNNSASKSYGGGLYYGSAYNCTIVGNIVRFYGGWSMLGGGAYRSGIYNSIVSGNYTEYGDPSDTCQVGAAYSCAPDLLHGVNGNITNSPMLLSFVRIATNSPCVGVASTQYVSGVDIDGEMWGTPPSMGCDEYAGSLTGELVLYIDGPSTNMIGHPYRYKAVISGRASGLTLDFGDGTVVSNQMVSVHTWSSTGVYSVVLTAYNDMYPSGISTTRQVRIITPEDAPIYVSAESGDDLNNGDSWQSAKKTIQAGINAQTYEGGLVLVGEGRYRLSSQILVNRPVLVKGFNGPLKTIVDGGGSNRCFSLSHNDSSVEGLTIMNGWTSGSGGGVECSTRSPVISNCIIRGNSAQSGGGISQGTAYRCQLIGNYATDYGGASWYSVLNGCVVADNTAGQYGGGLYECGANHCNIVFNYADKWWGGVAGGAVKDSIVYYNTAASGDPDSGNGATLTYSCSPALTAGVNGNISSPPDLITASHILPSSPCIGMGSTNPVSSQDIDGDIWKAQPTIGCDEPKVWSDLDGDLSVRISGDEQVVHGKSGRYFFDVSGQAQKMTVDFGDGTAVVTNSIGLEHFWNVAGLHSVVLTAYNATYPDGISVTQVVEVVSIDDLTIYVSQATGDDANDGLSLNTAKATIQAGVDAVPSVGGRVLVDDGVYFVTNGPYMASMPIVINRAIEIRSRNGAAQTIIDGGGVSQCLSLSGSCLVDGFTIQNGYSGYYLNNGGGVYCAGNVPEVWNCVVQNNHSETFGGGMYNGVAVNTSFIGNSADDGGGMFYGKAINCLFDGNSALYNGGGLSSVQAYNCTVVNNHASMSIGGMGWGVAYNTIFCSNSAPVAANYWSVSFSNSSSPDMTNSGVNGNIAAIPKFIDASSSDYRLAFNSPCINAGRNSYVTTSNDLDGNLRIVGGVVDMGAYEYDSSKYRLTVTGGAGGGAYTNGALVALVAKAPVGKAFDRWTGDTHVVASVTSPATTVTMPASNVAVIATYTDAYYALTVDGGTGGGLYTYATPVVISANTPAGKKFDRWTGYTRGMTSVTSSTTTVTMPASSVTVVATYKDVYYALTVTGGSGGRSYTNGTRVTIRAILPAGKAFSRWVGATQYVASATSSTTTVTMPAANISIKVIYKTAYYPLTVTGGTGGGSYTNGQKVTIAATVPKGMKFAGWNDGSTNASRIVTMPPKPVTYTANFIDLQKPTVTISYPTKSLRVVTNGAVVLRGTAADNGTLNGVMYQLYTGEWTNAVTTNVWKNWTAEYSPVSGLNTARVYSVDMQGNISATSTVVFTYAPGAIMQVQTNGAGTVKPDYDGQMLEIGKSYTMTAKAAAKTSVFTNWTCSTGADVVIKKTKITFEMQSNLVLTANFSSLPGRSALASAAVDMPATPHVVITVDGSAKDWAGVPRSSFSYASVTQEVAVALDGNNIALLLNGCPFSTSDNVLVYFKLRLSYGDGDDRHTVDLWTSGSVLYGMVDGKVIGGLEAVLLNGVLEVKLPIDQAPLQVTIEEVACGIDSGAGGIRELFVFPAP